MNPKRNLEDNPRLDENAQAGKDYMLILHNDDDHDFNFVIDSLVEICDHNIVQAEQCTYLVHYSGSCDVKKGKYSVLKEMYDGLIDKGLIVSLN
jgi:ATP-dependent Clp protease adaptor protein ClpS